MAITIQVTTVWNADVQRSCGWKDGFNQGPVELLELSPNIMVEMEGFNIFAYKCMTLLTVQSKQSLTMYMFVLYLHMCFVATTIVI